jgi:hypothetical protein
MATESPQFATTSVPLFFLSLLGFLLLTNFLAACDRPALCRVVPWPVWAGLAGLWGIVLASMLAGLNLCRCHGIVEVAEGFLRVEQANLFGRRQRQWPCEEIVAVQTGPTGLTNGGGTSATGVTIPGGTRVPELHLYTKDGERIRLFAGRSEEELDWIARELRQVLQVGTKDYNGG